MSLTIFRIGKHFYTGRCSENHKILNGFINGPTIKKIDHKIFAAKQTHFSSLKIAIFGRIAPNQKRQKRSEVQSFYSFKIDHFINIAPNMSRMRPPRKHHPLPLLPRHPRTQNLHKVQTAHEKHR